MVLVTASNSSWAILVSSAKKAHAMDMATQLTTESVSAKSMPRGTASVMRSSRALGVNFWVSTLAAAW